MLDITVKPNGKIGRTYWTEKDVKESSLRHNRFKLYGKTSYAVCSYDGCKKVNKSNYTNSGGQLYVPKCRKDQIKLSKALFSF